MHQLVKLLFNDDGVEIDNPPWCLVDPANRQGPSTLCSGEFFGEGESNCIYEEKNMIRGGITCVQCLSDIRCYKSIRL